MGDSVASARLLLEGGAAGFPGVVVNAIRELLQIDVARWLVVFAFCLVGAVTVSLITGSTAEIWWESPDGRGARAVGALAGFILMFALSVRYLPRLQAPAMGPQPFDARVRLRGRPRGFRAAGRYTVVCDIERFASGEKEQITPDPARIGSFLEFSLREVYAQDQIKVTVTDEVNDVQWETGPFHVYDLLREAHVAVDNPPRELSASRGGRMPSASAMRHDAQITSVRTSAVAAPRRELPVTSLKRPSDARTVRIASSIHHSSTEALLRPPSHLEDDASHPPRTEVIARSHRGEHGHVERR